jgi:hypothetical protein
MPSWIPSCVSTAPFRRLTLGDLSGLLLPYLVVLMNLYLAANADEMRAVLFPGSEPLLIPGTENFIAGVQSFAQVAFSFLLQLGFGVVTALGQHWLTITIAGIALCATAIVF